MQLFAKNEPRGWTVTLHVEGFRRRDWTTLSFVLGSGLFWSPLAKRSEMDDLKFSHFGFVVICTFDYFGCICKKF